MEKIKLTISKGHTSEIKPTFRDYDFTHLEDGRILISEKHEINITEELYPLGTYFPLIDTIAEKNGMTYFLTPIDKEEADKIYVLLSNKTPTNIPKNNLGKLLGREKGCMSYLLMNETIGGNAGTNNGKPCYGANFYYDRHTGEIMTFTNRTIENGRLCHGSFRLSADLGKKVLKIINFFNDVDRSRISEIAHSNIEATIALYNSRT